MTSETDRAYRLGWLRATYPQGWDEEQDGTHGDPVFDANMREDLEGDYPRPNAPAKASSMREEAIAAVFKDLRGRRLIKYLFDDNPDNCAAYGYVDAPIDLETQQEIVEKLVEIALAHTARPDAGDEDVERVARILAPRSWWEYDRFVDPDSQPKTQHFVMIYREGLTTPAQWKKWWAEDAAPPYVDYHISEWRSSLRKAREIAAMRKGAETKKAAAAVVATMRHFAQ